MPQLDPSAFWGIAGIVAGIIVATFFFLLGKKKTLLRCIISHTSVLTEQMSGILNDHISIDGHPIKSLAETTIMFINSGNQRIRSSDFSEQEPLCITLSGHLYGYDLLPGNRVLLPKIDLVDEKVLNVTFENLKPKQYFYVTILHDDSLYVSGELTTGDMHQILSRFPIRWR